PSGEERLTEGVVDLVGAGVGEVLALQVEVESMRESGGRVEGDGALQDLIGEGVGAVERGGPAGVVGKELAELGPEDRVVADRGVGSPELLERRHEGLRHVAPAELAL